MNPCFLVRIFFKAILQNNCKRRKINDVQRLTSFLVPLPIKSPKKVQNSTGVLRILQ